MARIRPFFVLVFFVLALLALPALAHKFHVSLAEIDVNAETDRLEVALRVTPEDLEDALERENGRRVNLDATEDVDALVVAYLEARFRVSDAEGRRSPLVWVGKEVSHKAAWLYFEIVLEGGPGFTLEDQVLVELGNEQVNTVLVRTAGEDHTLTFTADSGPQPLPIAGERGGPPPLRIR